ncbi:homeobox protein 2-like [Aphidius gifuensis]|uniref:homeobox protein 2-like n=1 Tax=Aphidius gifuensis TaxID=684658 RepID=UPI001CDB9E29|nr:homeobox protein 2-like [Aphidius gifuensis]
MEQPREKINMISNKLSAQEINELRIKFLTDGHFRVEKKDTIKTFVSKNNFTFGQMQCKESNHDNNNNNNSDGLLTKNNTNLHQATSPVQMNSGSNTGSYYIPNNYNDLSAASAGKQLNNLPNYNATVMTGNNANYHSQYSINPMNTDNLVNNYCHNNYNYKNN